MNPEEPLVSPFAVTLPDGLPRVLVQELANHRLRNCVDDRRVRRTSRWLAIRGLSLRSSRRILVRWLIVRQMLGRDR